MWIKTVIENGILKIIYKLPICVFKKHLWEYKIKIFLIKCIEEKLL